MIRNNQAVFCEGCGAEILWAPVIVRSTSGEKHDYCCELCRDGLECDCGRHMEIDDKVNE
jgi:hypothetical protein